MRLFAASIATETRPLSPLPTSASTLSGSVPSSDPANILRSRFLVPIRSGWARRRAATEGFTLVEGSCFAATPAGTTNRRDYEFMGDEILAQLEAARPVAAYFLGFMAPWWHTAMRTSKAT